MPTDQLVQAKDVLEAVMELRRQGSHRVLEHLEQIEPDLTAYAMEELSAIHQKLLDLGAKAKETRRLIRRIESLALVLVLSLRQGQIRLWQQDEPANELAKQDKPDADRPQRP